MAEYPISPKHNVFKKYRTVNYINSYVFAPPVSLTTNTEIGGVASTISTPALLATKLDIDVSRITNFSIVGSDIKCKITGGYPLPTSCFESNTNITYFTDSDNLVNEIGVSAFRLTTKIKYIELNGAIIVRFNAFNSSNVEYVVLKNCTNVLDSAFAFAGNMVYAYIPNLVNLGSTNGIVGGGVFENSSPKVYLPTYFSTNNAGAKDGDLVSQVTPVYISNSTVPSTVTTLAVNTAYNTAIKLSFTAPSSTNSIDYYEVYVNGALNNRCDFGSVVAKGLNDSTTYTITVLAVDIYLNKSNVSNALIASTNTTSYINSTMIAAYGLANGSDVTGNGYAATVGGAVTYATAKNGNGSVLTNVSGSSLLVADNNAMSFTDGTKDKEFSISCWVKFDSVTGNQWIISKFNEGSGNEWHLGMTGSKMNAGLYGVDGNLGIIGSTTLIINTWYQITLTYNRNAKSSGLSLYLNGVLENSTLTRSSFYKKMTDGTANVIIGMYPLYNIYHIIGTLDELYISNSELRQPDINKMQTLYYPF